jgi:hypothetical protein
MSALAPSPRAASDSTILAESVNWLDLSTQQIVGRDIVVLANVADV